MDDMDGVDCVYGEGCEGWTLLMGRMRESLELENLKLVNLALENLRRTCIVPYKSMERGAERCVLDGLERSDELRAKPMPSIGFSQSLSFG